MSIWKNKIYYFALILKQQLIRASLKGQTASVAQYRAATGPMIDTGMSRVAMTATSIATRHSPSAATRGLLFSSAGTECTAVVYTAM